MQGLFNDSAKTRFLVVVGTRPEAIKLSPVIIELRTKTRCTVDVVYTRQHADLVLPIFDFFGVTVNTHVSLRRGEDVGALYSELLSELSKLIVQTRPSAVIVQGDTASACAAGMAGFLSKTPVVHVEAGLRTGDMSAPWPEEFNRRVISLGATWHFAHSESAKANLTAEGIPGEQIVISGNTGIDAALIAESRVGMDQRYWQEFLGKYPGLDETGDFILLTVHRRENHGQPLDYICDAIDTIVDTLGYQVVIPVHPNPEVSGRINRRFGDRDRVILTSPLNYPVFMSVMLKAKFILTDSGGIQEEAPCLGKPCVVLRESTERQEVAELGSSLLVGASADAIVAAATRLTNDAGLFREMSMRRFPFGKGDASRIIASSLISSEVEDAAQ